MKLLSVGERNLCDAVPMPFLASPKVTDELLPLHTLDAEKSSENVKWKVGRI